jgi:hypothetical protein
MANIIKLKISPATLVRYRSLGAIALAQQRIKSFATRRQNSLSQTSFIRETLGEMLKNKIGDVQNES